MLKNKKVFEVKSVYRSILCKWKQSKSKDEINQFNLKNQEIISLYNAIHFEDTPEGNSYILEYGLST